MDIIGQHQVEKGNVNGVKCEYLRDEGKKITFRSNKSMVNNVLDDFSKLMMLHCYELEDIGFDIFASENYYGKVLISSSVIRSMYLLEKAGCFEYDIDNGEVLIEINGMETIKRTDGNVLITLEDINNNPNLSNVFAEMGPPQDLTDKIHNDDDARKAAKTFSEGRKSLEDLIYYCIINNIKTFASCAGHEENTFENQDGYISFNIDDERTRNFIKYLNSKFSYDEYSVSISETGDSRTLVEAMYCNYWNADALYTGILEVLQEYITNKDVRDESNEENALNKKIDDMLLAKENENSEDLIIEDMVESATTQTQESIYSEETDKSKQITEKSKIMLKVKQIFNTVKEIFNRNKQKQIAEPMDIVEPGDGDKDDITSIAYYKACLRNNRAEINRLTKYVNEYTEKFNRIKKDYLPGQKEFEDAKDEMYRWMVALDMHKSETEFIRPNTQEDIDYRKKIVVDYPNELKEALSPNFDLRFHSTSIGFTKQIIQSGEISSTPDRYDGYIKNSDGKDVISVSDRNDLSRTIHSYANLNLYTQALPAGCIFALLPKDKEDASRYTQGVMSRVDFTKNPEQLYGICTTPENIQKVKMWMSEAGLNPDIVYTYEEFLNVVRLRSDIEEQKLPLRDKIHIDNVPAINESFYTNTDNHNISNEGHEEHDAK